MLNRLRIAALGAAAAVLLTVTGCTAPSASSSATSANCPGSEAPLASLTLEPTPSGAAHACLADTSVPLVPGVAEPELPVTVTDRSGQDVTVSSLERVIALDVSGTIAATVVALGLSDTLIARDTSSQLDEVADLPVVTQSGHTLSAEPILALNPTLVLTDGSIGPNRVLRQLRDAGIPVVMVTDERGIEANRTLTSDVAAALGVPARGAQLNALVDERIAATQADVETLRSGSSPRAVFLYLRGTGSIYYLFGSGSGADQLISALGATDVATQLGWQGEKPVTAEALVAAAPDVIFVMSQGLESVGGVDGLLSAIPAIAQTPAGQTQRIIDMADSEVLAFGPRTAGILDALARALYAPSSLSGL